MSETQLLYLILWLLCVWECLLWVPRESVLFVSRFRAGWRPAGSAPIFENPRKALFVSNPLPGLGSTIVCCPWSISISPRAIFSYVSQAKNPGQRAPQAERFWLLSDVKEIGVSGAHVRINKGDFLNAGSSDRAAAIAGLIKSVTQSKPEQRDGVIRKALNDSLDAKAVASRYSQYARLGRALRLHCNVLFVYLFVVVPILVLQFGFSKIALPLFGTLGVLIVITVIEFFRKHRVLYPPARHSRWEHVAAMVFCPPAAARAHHFLSKDLLGSFHPLAAASVLCANDDYRDYAARVLRDLEHPIVPVCEHEHPLAAEIEVYFRSILKETVEHLLRSTNVDPRLLLNPPEQDEDGSRSFCPRCHGQFLLTEGTCSQCGIALHAFVKRELEAVTSN